MTCNNLICYIDSIVLTMFYGCTLAILFFFSAVVLVYTYLGYPSSIYIMSKLHGKPFALGDFEPNVSIIMVAYNEELNIGKKIEACLASNYPKDKIEMVLVSDGSTDQTDAIIRGYADQNVKLLNVGQQRGKSACLNDGVAAAGADYLVFCDVRQNIDASAIKELMRYFHDKSIGAVSGEMFFKDSSEKGYSEGFDFYWRYEKFIRKSEAKFRSVIGATGALYAIRKNCYKTLPSELILDDVMTPMNVAFNGKKVVYSSEARIYDVPSQDIKKEEKRKRRTISGNYQLINEMPELLSFRKNPLWFEFISHKVLRLLSPFMFALFVLSSLWLSGSGILYLLGFIGSIVLVVFALMGYIKASFNNNFLVKASLGFMSLNYFAFMGFYDYFTGKSLGKWK